MSSITEQIMEALEAAAQSVVGLTPYRSRQRAVAEGKLPAVVLLPQDDTPQADYSLDEFSWRALRVHFELRLAGNDADADVYRVPLHAAIMSDRTLGGLAFNLSEGQSNWQFQDDGQEYCALSTDYTVQYRTLQVDLTADTTNEGVL